MRPREDAPSGARASGWAGLVDDVEHAAPRSALPRPPATEPAEVKLAPEAAELERLLDVSAAPPPAPVSSPASAPNRRALVTVVLGALAFGAALAYSGGPPAHRAPRTRAVPRMTPRPAPAPTPEARTPAPTPPSETIPMLTVVSSPPGALVELGGAIYGRTPLVIESPDPTSLQVTLRKPGHRTWTQVVRPDAAGHFNVKVALEPSGG